MAYLGQVDRKASNIQVFNVASSTSATHNIGWTPPSEQTIIVTINGVKQHTNAYSFSGAVLTLSSALFTTHELEVIGITDIGNSLTPVDGSVTASKLGADSVITAKINDDAVTTAKILDNNVTLAKMAGGTDGNLITYDASGDPAYVATGVATNVLTSNGAGAAPTFQAAAAGGLVLQVIGATKTNTESTASTTYVDASLSVTITSASTASRFLLTLAGGQVSNSTVSRECLTTFYVDTGSGAAEVSDTGPYELHKQDNYHATNRAPHSSFCLHSPVTAGSITYYCYFKTSSGGIAHFNTATARCQFNVMELSS